VDRPQILAPRLVRSGENSQPMDGPTKLLITVAFLTAYVIGIGGTTAAAIRVSESWRRRGRNSTDLGPLAGEVVLKAPSLPRAVGVLRIAGWVAFPVALVLALFVTREYPWVAPVAVLVMVALNAFYFTAMQGIGETLTLRADGFQLGASTSGRTVRWVHVTDLAGAHIGAFRGTRMSEAGEWQDPKTNPNVIFYRLNRALVKPRRKTISQRWGGLTYYDGIVRNTFGVTTESLLRAMREWQQKALEAEGPPLRRPMREEKR
jgi:hypothetical protein